MKLIRWVEVHIGRSRRKTKKEKDGSEGRYAASGSDIPRRRDDSIPGTPLHKIEPIGNDLPVTRSAGNTPRRIKPPSSPHTSVGAPSTPSAACLGNKFPHPQQSQHMRTNFPEPSPIPSLGALSTLDTGSPRQRSRIRTNPWLPSPRSSGEAGLGRRRASSSLCSESTESVSGSAFSSQSSGSIWDEPWSAFRGGGPSPSAPRLPRVTLEHSPGRRPVQSPFKEGRSQCSAAFSRPIPRSAWIDFREIGNTLLVADESSDEAYSEDYAEEEDHSDTHDDGNVTQDTGSPQADSACGSDRDNSSSCSTTPLSETATATRPAKIADKQELLQDKVQRLRLEQELVHKRVCEAREEEIVRREEQLVLRRELVQFRRLILLQTLTELRDQIERRYDSPSPSGSWFNSELM